MIYGAGKLACAPEHVYANALESNELRHAPKIYLYSFGAAQESISGFQQPVTRNFRRKSRKIITGALELKLF